MYDFRRKRVIKFLRADSHSVDEVADYLKLDKNQRQKALLFVTYDALGNENGYVAAFIRGDRELNMI